MAKAAHDPQPGKSHLRPGSIGPVMNKTQPCLLFSCRVQLPRQGRKAPGRRQVPPLLLQPQQILKLDCGQRGELLTSLQAALYYHFPTPGGLTATHSHSVAPGPGADVRRGSHPTIKMAFSSWLKWHTESSSPRGGAMVTQSLLTPRLTRLCS